jgi:serine protease Do
MGVLDELGAALTRVAQKAAPAVVGIGRWHRGSGVVVGANRVLTNAHNVRRDEVTVTFADGRETRGKVLGVDVDGDLAVVEVETGGVEALAWADSQAPAVGAPVFAVASSSEAGTRVTFGTVSGIGRSFRGPGGRLIRGSIEHTAPLAPGSSGSALVDAEGRLLGLNTQRIGEGFYLAVPADATLRARVDALARGESTVRPRLGIAVAPAHVARHLRRAVGLPDRAGVLVRGVEEGSAAEKAGIREGDLIVSAGDAPVDDPDALHDALAAAGTGKLAIGLVRGADELTVEADLGGPAPKGRGPKGN